MNRVFGLGFGVEADPGCPNWLWPNSAKIARPDKNGTPDTNDNDKNIKAQRMNNCRHMHEQPQGN